MENKRILVTGATGQIGRGLVHVLSKQNEVHALARFTHLEKAAPIRKSTQHIWQIDMGSEKPDALPDDFDVIFHEAVTWLGDDDLELQNRSFHLSCDFVADLMRRNRPAVFVLGSTGSVYKASEGKCKEDETPLQGESTYVDSKIAMSHMARWLSQQFGHRVVELRYWMPFAPYAPHPKVDRFLKGDFPGANPAMPHERTYIKHHVDKTIAAVEHARCPIEIFNCATDEELTLSKLAQIGARITGAELSEKARQPGAPVGAGHFADTTKAVRMLGPTPVSAEEGLRRYLKAQKENITEPEDWMFQDEPI